VIHIRNIINVVEAYPIKSMYNLAVIGFVVIRGLAMTDVHFQIGRNS